MLEIINFNSEGLGKRNKKVLKTKCIISKKCIISHLSTIIYKLVIYI